MKVKLERIKRTKAGKAWAAARSARLVRIIGDGYYWAPNRSGYTSDGLAAGVYVFSDALHASGHCGAEKNIIYDFLPHGHGVPTQEARGPAALMLAIREV